MKMTYDGVQDLTNAAGVVGGKALGLWRSMALPIVRVPSFFVVPTEALESAMRRTGLDTAIDEHLRLDGVRADDSFEHLRRDVLAATIPPDIYDEVACKACELLESSPRGLAVRSSGCAEDSPRASFAGVYESRLGVDKVEDVWTAIKECWCSGWSPRALQYAKMRKVSTPIYGMAVVVQTMVDAECSGVLFTADPVSGNPWRFLLSSVSGLAADLVGGKVRGDSFFLDWETGTVQERNVVGGVSSLPAAQPGKNQDGPSSDWAASVNDDMIHDLWFIGLSLDRLFDARLDIEWAARGRDIYVVQVRPVSSLPAFFPVNLSGSDAKRTWELSEPVWVRSAEDGSKLMAPLYRDVFAAELWMRHQPKGDGTKVFGRPVAVERDFNGYRYSTPWVWGGPWHDHRRTEQWLDRHEEGLRKDWSARTAATLEMGTRAAALLSRQADVRETMAFFMKMRDAVLDTEAASYAASQSIGGIMTEWILPKFLKEYLPDVEMTDLLQGVPSYSYERTLAVQRLARGVEEPVVKEAFLSEPVDGVIAHLVRRHPECRFLRSYRQFCWEFGLKSSVLGECGRWDGVEPVELLVVLRETLAGRVIDAETMMANCRDLRRQKEASVRARLGRDNPVVLSRFDKLLSWTQYWSVALDDRKRQGHTWMDCVLQRLGMLLVRHGVIPVWRDVLLFEANDLRVAAEKWNAGLLQDIWLFRKMSHERNKRLVPVANVGLKSDSPSPGSDGPGTTAEVKAGEAATQTCFHGRTLSGGQVRGKCRVVGDLRNPRTISSISRGDIVVSVDPVAGCYADWFSLFMVAKGAVTAWGDYLHHVSQIARECGVVLINLPLGDAERLPDGRMICLDGSTGNVTVLPQDCG